MKSYEKYLFEDKCISNYHDGLREYSTDANGLNKCLEKLFPNYVFIHNKFLKLNNAYVTNKYGQKIKPDYVCEELKLIIEYDGDQHYTDPIVIFKDIINTECLTQLGYKVVRIPYYIQLDYNTIKYLFNVEYKTPLYEMCYDHGFTHPLAKLPTTFCIDGIKRFRNELFNIPGDTLKHVFMSLSYRIKYFKDNYDNDASKMLVIPTTLHDMFKHLFSN